MAENPLAKQRVVLELAGMDDVSVEPNVPYGPGARRRMSIFRPRQAAARLPAVIFVSGYPDAGAEKIFGCRLMDMAAYVCWARLVACTGLVAILYENEEPHGDVRSLLEHVTSHADSLGVDAKRLGVWSCSGNVPNALGVLAENAELRCAALCYGYTSDLDGHREVAAAAAQFGFVNPPNLSIAALRGTPLLLVRAGRDEAPGLNAALDRFALHALAANLPVTLINYPEGPHAFDIADASDGARAAIRQILDFLKVHLLADSGTAAAPR